MKSKGQIIRGMAEALRKRGLTDSADYWEQVADQIEGGDVEVSEEGHEEDGQTE